MGYLKSFTTVSKPELFRVVAGSGCCTDIEKTILLRGIKDCGTEYEPDETSMAAKVVDDVIRRSVVNKARNELISAQMN